jgi:hypothetical protein
MYVHIMMTQNKSYTKSKNRKFTGIILIERRLCVPCVVVQQGVGVLY